MICYLLQLVLLPDTSMGKLSVSKPRFIRGSLLAGLEEYTGVALLSLADLHFGPNILVIRGASDQVFLAAREDFRLSL